MKVYLFSDYLASIRAPELRDLQAIAEIEALESLPEGLVRINGSCARVCSINITGESSCYIQWVEEPAGEDECLHEEEATCPHCGDKSRDSWELPEECEKVCEACGSTYSITRYVEVTYSTRVIERNCEVVSMDTQ